MLAVLLKVYLHIYIGIPRPTVLLTYQINQTDKLTCGLLAIK